MRRILIAACALVLLVVLPGVVIKRGPGAASLTSILAALFTDSTVLANGEVLVWDSTATQIVGGGDPPLTGEGDPRGSENATSVGQVYIDSEGATPTGLRWYATATGTDNWVNSSWYSTTTNLHDSSFTDAQRCFFPSSWAAPGSTCGTYSQSRFVGAGTTLTVTDVSGAVFLAVDATNEACSLGVASGNIGSATVVDFTHFIYTRGNAADVATGDAVIAIDDNYNVILPTPHTVAAGDWFSIEARDLVAADCTAAGRPSLCCGGFEDVGTCATNCARLQGISATLKYLEYAD